MVRTPLSSGFVRHLKGLLSPHGLLVQNFGSLAAPRLALRRFTIHRKIFEYSWPLALATLQDTYSANNDRQWRHSPRLIVLSSNSAVDPLAVDWKVWQAAGIETTFYHASIHRSMFVLPAEVQDLLQAA